MERYTKDYWVVDHIESVEEMFVQIDFNYKDQDKDDTFDKLEAPLYIKPFSEGTKIRLTIEEVVE